MKSVVFYDKDTKQVMGTGRYSNPDDIPKQFPYVEVEEAIVEDSDSILEVYDDAGVDKVRIIGTIPTPPTIEETLATLVADVKLIKEKVGVEK